MSNARLLKKGLSFGLNFRFPDSPNQLRVKKIYSPIFELALFAIRWLTSSVYDDYRLRFALASLRRASVAPCTPSVACLPMCSLVSRWKAFCIDILSFPLFSILATQLLISALTCGSAMTSSV